MYIPTITTTCFLRAASASGLARHHMANMLTDTSQPNISLSEQAYLRLRQEILICNLAPGEVVSERVLARRYEMSKTPIREALTQVCREGLMQRLPGRGYMVAPITIQDIRELFDLRLILEIAAAERAVQHPSPHLIALLKQISTVRYSFDDPQSRVYSWKRTVDSTSLWPKLQAITGWSACWKISWLRWRGSSIWDSVCVIAARR